MACGPINTFQPLGGEIGQTASGCRKLAAMSAPQGVETQTIDRGGLRSIRRNLFGEYDDREENHPNDVHHAGGDQHGEQRPAAAKAVEPMLHSHLKSADPSIAPVLRHEGRWRAAISEANVL